MSLPRAAAGSAAAFAFLLVPAAAAHTGLHSAEETGVAHADGPADMSASGMAEESHGVAGDLLHGAGDALLALPAAFLPSLGALALLGGRRGRGPRARAQPVARAGRLGPRRRGRGGARSRQQRGQPGLCELLPAAEDSAGSSPARTSTSDGADPGADPAHRSFHDRCGPTTAASPARSSAGRRGCRPRVTFANNLPASAGSMTVHHHGAHPTEDNDGHPSRYLIAPGASKTYTYPAVEDGAPERAAPQWYHDHRDMVTGRNNWVGLVGTFIYDDAFEGRPNLPKGQYDVPLIVSDRELDSTNQIPYTFNPSGVTGDVILVNGAPSPTTRSPTGATACGSTTSRTSASTPFAWATGSR